jgi:actin-related protein
VSLINLYYKFNKNEQVGYQKKKEKESENTNEITEIYEINEEKNYSTKKLFDYDLEYYYEFNYPSIVIDNGSTYLRSGISCDNWPISVIPNCIGYPSLGNKKSFDKEYLIGKDAEDSRELLNIKYPIQRGIVEDIDELEKIYDHIFNNEMRVDPSCHNVLITGFSVDSMKKKEKIAEMMFEIFDVPGLLFSNQTICSLYAYGRINGIVVDLSDSLTHLAP